MEAIYLLWEQMDRFPAGETDRALLHLARNLKKLLNASNVKWMAAVRIIRGAKAKKDALLGWRMRGRYSLIPISEKYQKLIESMFQRDKVDSISRVGITSNVLMQGAGKIQVHRLRDGWVPFREFERSEHFRIHYTDLGITDRIWVSIPLNADTESIFLIDRSRNEPRFTKREAFLAAAVLRGISGFHRRLFLSRGLLIGDKSLSPVFQRIVQKLLTGMSEREIAVAMDQSISTTHKYIQTIYQRFGVNGRAALMSIWLGA
jgi:DNA-binding CsgD family transcriptional regulator